MHTTSWVRRPPGVLDVVDIWSGVGNDDYYDYFSEPISTIAPFKKQ